MDKLIIIRNVTSEELDYFVSQCCCILDNGNLVIPYDNLDDVIELSNDIGFEYEIVTY